ncbi:MAG: GDP-mannose 4,6-dehydratase, partial [Elusimicrobia bacterium]|nr:GDP-mannose 4,6-dehydratase [Elusimicrobiota bacterium]
AGVISSADPQLLMRANCGISENLLNIVVKSKFRPKKILLIGSAAEYGNAAVMPISENCALNPVSDYGRSKAAQTQCAMTYFRQFGVNLNIARTFNVIGRDMPQCLSIASFARQIKSAKDGDSIYVGNISSKRDFIDISDAADAYWRILINGTSGEIYNVCRGESFGIKDVLDCLIKKSGKKLSIKTKEEFVRKNDILDSFGDNSKLKRDTGWSVNIGIYQSLECLL